MLPAILFPIYYSRLANLSTYLHSIYIYILRIYSIKSSPFYSIPPPAQSVLPDQDEKGGKRGEGTERERVSVSVSVRVDLEDNNKQSILEDQIIDTTDPYIYIQTYIPYIHIGIHTERLFGLCPGIITTAPTAPLFISPCLPASPSLPLPPLLALSPCLDQSLLAKSRPHATIWTGSLAAPPPSSSSSIISYPTICID